MIGQMREIVTSAQKATRKGRGVTRIAASTSRHQLGRTSPFRRIRILPTRRQTTCHPPNRSTRLRSGSRGRISHHRPVPPAAGGPGLGRLPADERIQRLRADRWIGYPRAVEALNRLEALYAWPNKQRMPKPACWLARPKQWQVDDRRESSAAPTRPAPTPTREHIPVLGRADAVRAGP
ncbi:transposition protein [Escherichia coli]|nr:transposition protein [Escherichia coli]